MICYEIKWNGLFHFKLKRRNFWSVWYFAGIEIIWNKVLLLNSIERNDGKKGKL